ncbi:uncharacterized protein LOC131257765 isoform X2 [Magnolia sinica]|uniref:uncharacterized protein LOC131257765 isoform X2 n=1 Tax=Magnolia sinica TaxID=86752 RepID=UPI00265B5DB6|nr:uncharacterized protein LOC131257765 isoform X2 [Magnolia sinica]
MATSINCCLNMPTQTPPNTLLAPLCPPKVTPNPRNTREGDEMERQKDVPTMACKFVGKRCARKPSSTFQQSAEIGSHGRLSDRSGSWGFNRRCKQMFLSLNDVLLVEIGALFRLYYIHGFGTCKN